MGFLRVESALKAKAGAPPVAFPGNIAGTVLWVASDGAKTLVDTDRLSQWNDGSSNSNHLVQTTSTLRPFWVTNQLNTFPVADFRGDASGLNGHVLLSTTNADAFWPAVTSTTVQNAELWVVFRIEALRASNHLLSINSGSSANVLQLRGSANGLQFAYRDAANALTQFETTMTVNTYGIARLRKAGTTVTGYLNGLQVGQATDARHAVMATTGGNVPFTLGGRDDGTNCFDGKVLECWIGNQLLSTADAAALEAYLYDRYGLIVQYGISPAVGGKTSYAAGDAAMTVNGPGTWTVTPTTQFASTVTLWGPGGSSGGTGTSITSAAGAGSNTTFSTLSAGAGGVSVGTINNTAGTGGSAGTGSGGTTNTDGDTGGTGTIGTTSIGGTGAAAPNGGGAATGGSSASATAVANGTPGNAPGGGAGGAARGGTSSGRRASGGGGSGAYVLRAYAAGDLTAGTPITLTVGDSGAAGVGGGTNPTTGGKGAAGRTVITLPAPPAPPAVAYGGETVSYGGQNVEY